MLNPVYHTFTIETVANGHQREFSFDENMFVQRSNGCSLIFTYAQTHDICVGFSHALPDSGSFHSLSFFRFLSLSLTNTLDPYVRVKEMLRVYTRFKLLLFITVIIIFFRFFCSFILLVTLLSWPALMYWWQFEFSFSVKKIKAIFLVGRTKKKTKFQLRDENLTAQYSSGMVHGC